VGNTAATNGNLVGSWTRWRGLPCGFCIKLGSFPYTPPYKHLLRVGPIARLPAEDAFLFTVSDWLGKQGSSLLNSGGDPGTKEAQVYSTEYGGYTCI